ncbi:MAG: mannose-1-phosphate guanylyltransferase [Bacteroidaceae bacterium]|nr:mannose-1-phosphate guanylyltransferase [Bacteroidaceae bacterium]
MEAHNYCLILAGGIGSRLWPMSRKGHPKQFIDIFGTGRTLLQETYERFRRFMPADHIYISTNVDYLSLVYEQLPEVDDTHILEEPLHRGTVASVAWGTVFIKNIDPEACIIASPADQVIINEDLFQSDVRRSLDFVAQGNRMLVMGIRPTRPETGYGYVQMGDETDAPDITRLKAFTEKPERQYAEIFMQDGSFLWNTGIILFSVDAMLNSLYKLVPEYQVEIPRMMADAEIRDPKFLPEFFSVLPKLGIDLGIMEKSDNVYVYTCHFGWADLGTWGTIGEHHLADFDENLLLDTQALLHDCHGNVVRLPQGRMAVIKGLRDFVVAEEGDVLMICPKEDVAAQRRMMTEAQTQLGVE